MTAKAPPDGYTLLLAYHQHTVNAVLNPNLPYHVVNDFTPITQLTAAGFLLLVNPASPPHTLQEFIDWTKRATVPMNFGSAGLGTGGHLAGELYKQMTGVKAQHIPYKGSGPSFIDLIGGRYEFTFAGLQGAQAQVRGGKLRAIAVTTPKRPRRHPGGAGDGGGVARIRGGGLVRRDRPGRHAGAARSSACTTSWCARSRCPTCASASPPTALSRWAARRANSVTSWPRISQNGRSSSRKAGRKLD